MSNYDNPELRYSCLSEPIQVPHSHPRSLSLRERRRKHHLFLMYRLSKIETYIDTDRPEIVLRSRDKIKFRTPVTKLMKVMKSPYYRGVSLWDMLNEEQQKATTKVRFKQGLE